MKTLMKYLSILVPVGTLLFLVIRGVAFRDEMSFEVFANVLMVLFIVNAIVFVYYLVHIWKNVAITRDQKVMWTVMTVMFTILSQVIYWFKFLRKA